MKVKKTCLLILAILFFMTPEAFSLQYTFHPRVSATEEYTSNVFLSEDDEEEKKMMEGWFAKIFSDPLEEKKSKS